jgi:hypothetical protein
MSSEHQHQSNNLRGLHDATMSAALAPQVPSANSVAALSRDYAELSGLMAQLDREVGSFTRNMEKLNDNVPQHAGLTTLWEEQAKSLRRDMREATERVPSNVLSTAAKRRSQDDTKNGSDRSDAAYGDDAHNKNDKLVFI